MAKKKKQKHPHIDKSPVRKRKAKKWIQTYKGTDIVKDYRAYFLGVDVACAVRELQEIGYEFESGYVENVVRNEQVRINQLRKKKEVRRDDEDEYYDFQDENFFYIAGYTSGGAPYGVQWWEMGLEPGQSPFDDPFDDDDEIIEYRHYEFLKKWEQDSIDSRLREDFSEYVSTYRRLPSKSKQKQLIEKVFGSCAGGPLHYSKDFNATYRKICRKRENKFIREGVLPKRFTPTEIKNYFAQSIMLESERLIFRKITADDFDDLAVIFRNEEVMGAWGQVFSDEQIHNRIANQAERYQKEVVGWFAAICKDTGAFIGQMGLIWSDFEELRALEVACMLKSEYWGMGYATEGATALTQYGFTEIGVNRIYSAIHPKNKRAIQTAERIGMSTNGSYMKHCNGEEIEHLIYFKDRE